MAAEPPKVLESLAQLINALRGIATFSPPPQPGPHLGDASTIEIRKALGGQLEALPQTRLRWYPPDIEKAQRMADTGDMMLIGQLGQSMRVDGTYRGLFDARTAAITLPKKWTGDATAIKLLQSKNFSDRDVYEEMIPETEKRLMMWEGDHAGVSVGQMVKVEGRNFPVLIRRYTQNLKYIWTTNQWYYKSVAGLMPIDPGIPDANGEWWVLHIPGGRLSPWNSGLWNTTGRSYINKTQSIFARQSWEMKHAHPARVAFSPVGATEIDRKGLLRGIIAWAMNAAFDLPVGWDIKLVESNGRGFDVYEKSIATADNEMATAICGSKVALEGSVGFGNNDMFKKVGKDIVRATVRAWDHTENTQIIAPLIGTFFGVDALKNATTVETDLTEPEDNAQTANTLVALGNAIKALVESLAAAQIATGTKKPVAIDPEALLRQFGVVTVPAEVSLLDKAAAGAAGMADGGNSGNETKTPGGEGAKSPKDPGPKPPQEAATIEAVGKQGPFTIYAKTGANGVELVKSYISKEGKKWVVHSEDGKKLGEYGSKEEAEKRLREIEYFKHHKETTPIEETSDGGSEPGENEP